MEISLLRSLEARGRPLGTERSTSVPGLQAADAPQDAFARRVERADQQRSQESERQHERDLSRQVETDGARSQERQESDPGRRGTRTPARGRDADRTEPRERETDPAEDAAHAAFDLRDQAVDRRSAAQADEPVKDAPEAAEPGPASPGLPDSPVAIDAPDSPAVPNALQPSAATSAAETLSGASTDTSLLAGRSVAATAAEAHAKPGAARQLRSGQSADQGAGGESALEPPGDGQPPTAVAPGGEAAETSDVDGGADGGDSESGFADAAQGAPAVERTAAQAAALDRAPLAGGPELPAGLHAVEAPPTPGTPPRPPLRTEQAAEVFRQVRLQLSSGAREATIHLHPAWLGRVSIRIAVRDGRARAELRAERPEALQALEKHLPELRAALTERGFASPELHLELGLGGDGGKRAFQPPAGPSARIALPADLAGESGLEPPSHRTSITDLGVDTYA